MASLKPVTFGPFIRGVDASTDVLSQPKGSVPRISNMLLTKRGGLKTCDGSAIINAYNGVPTPGRGKDICTFFFKPTGVAPYYLRLMKALDQPLGSPRNLAAADGGSGGSLTGTFFYVVTATDNVGGETVVSNEVSISVAANHKVNLSWNFVPNAVAYNVYRGASSGSETLLSGAGFPVPQPVAGTTSVTFTDLGNEPNPTILINKITITFASFATGNQATFSVTGNAIVLQPNQVIHVSGSSVSAFNTAWKVTNVTSNVSFSASTFPQIGTVGQISSGGSFSSSANPPLADTSQQTALYAMPPAFGGIPYTNANIVALFPADASPVLPDGGPGGGGQNPGHQVGTTPSGGAEGNVSQIPQIVQFTNQAVLALGNGFSPQVYSDPNGTPTNPATSVAISSISVDANGVVTINTATAHNINAAQGVGANVIISGVANPAYSTNGNGASAFVTISIPSGTSVTVRNLSAIGQASSSGGTLTVSTIPVISTFVPSYPQWTASVNYAANSIIVPTVTNGHYYKAVQGGTSGGSQPTFPTTTGGQIADGGVIWRESGLLNSAAPAPPGCGHIAVYAGSVWMFNTSPSSTANGLDGPCSLRMSDVNNLQSWNPINQAFLDKDDGQEGMGLGTFTITAQGIPPEGSLAAFKQFSTYQIVGVFGSSNFAIQRVQTDMGIIAPRTLQFAPGFGLVRLAHLGYAVFDGVTDRVISPQIQPYLFASDDPDLADITVMDQNAMALSQSSVTANPPMYVSAIPIGNSNGLLTQIMCFDLVLKAWSIVNLPFPITSMAQARSTVSTLVTLLGSATDGTLQRWQAGDQEWEGEVPTTVQVISASWTSFGGGDNEAAYIVPTTFGFGVGQQITVTGNSNSFFNVTGATIVSVNSAAGEIAIFIGGTGTQSGTGGTIQLADVGSVQAVSGFFRTPTVSSKDGYVRLFCRRVILRGQQGNGSATIAINPRVAGVYQGEQNAPVLPSGDINTMVPVEVTNDRFDADVFFTGQLTIDAVAWEVVPKPAGVLAGAIS